MEKLDRILSEMVVQVMVWYWKFQLLVVRMQLLMALRALKAVRRFNRWLDEIEWRMR